MKRSLVCILGAAFIPLTACKTKSKRPTEVPTSTTMKPPEQVECGPALYAYQTQVDEPAKLPAPKLNIIKVKVDGGSYPVISASLDDNADVVYYRSCKDSEAKADKNGVICQNASSLREGIIYLNDETTGYIMRPLFGMFGAVAKDTNFKYQAFNCDFANRIGKDSSMQFSPYKGYTLHCGVKSTKDMALQMAAPKDAAAISAYDNLDREETKYVAEFLTLFADTSNYLQKIRTGEVNPPDAEVYKYLLQFRGVGPSIGMMLGQTDALDQGAEAAARKMREEKPSLGLTEEGKTITSPECKAVETIPTTEVAANESTKTAEAAAKVADVVTAVEPPPAPPPVSVPSSATTPEAAPDKDPYAADKAECAQRDIREKSALGKDLAGTWAWNDTRSICTYAEPNGAVSDIPDVGNTVVVNNIVSPKLSDAEIALGSTLITLGSITVLGVTRVGVRLALDSREMRKTIGGTRGHTKGISWSYRNPRIQGEGGGMFTSTTASIDRGAKSAWYKFDELARRMRDSTVRIVDVPGAPEGIVRKQLTPMAGNDIHIGAGAALLASALLGAGGVIAGALILDKKADRFGLTEETDHLGRILKQAIKVAKRRIAIDYRAQMVGKLGSH